MQKQTQSQKEEHSGVGAWQDGRCCQDWCPGLDPWPHELSSDLYIYCDKTTPTHMHTHTRNK